MNVPDAGDYVYVLEPLGLLGQKPLATATVQGWVVRAPLEALIVGSVRPSFGERVDFAFARVGGEWRGAAVVHERDERSMEALGRGVIRPQDVLTWRLKVAPANLPGDAAQALLDDPAIKPGSAPVVLDGTSVELARATTTESDSLTFNTLDERYRRATDALGGLLETMGLEPV